VLGSQTNLELWSRIQSSRSRFALPPISTLNDEKSSIQLGPTAEASATGVTAGQRGEGAERKAFEELERGMGLAGNVFLPEAVSDELLSSYYYESCDVFVLPSAKEGFGIVFLEAMYYRKPCIGTRAGGVPEVIRDGDSGVLVDGSELSTRLPEAILCLLRDPALRGTMGANGGAEFESNFSFSCFRDRLEQILCSPGPRVTKTPLCRSSLR
jgi:glycosyltransferase involved in cell wall biosynthesis